MKINFQGHSNTIVKNIGRIRWDRVILLAVITAGAVALMLQMLIGAVVQTSLRLNPPTEAEIAEDPTLVRYLHD